MVGYLTNYAELNAFLFGANHFPEGTPNRWELVSEFVRGEGIDISKEFPTIFLGKGGNSNGNLLNLKRSEDCRTINKLIKKEYDMLFRLDLNAILYHASGKSALKPIILVPHVLNCCQKRIKMDNRPSFPLVYTMSGTYVAAVFHGQCGKCQAKFYPNYKVVEGKRIYQDPRDESMRYFQVTSQTVFEKQLLMDFSNNIWVNGATFESRAKVYNLNFGAINETRLSQLDEFSRTKDGGWRLNEDRVNDAWFLWIIVNYYHRNDKLKATGLEFKHVEGSNHVAIEKLCECLWRDICVSPNKWVRHTCKTPGCSEGYVTVDGNEYLKRGKCALPKEKVKMRRDLPEVYKCCPNSPVAGGKTQKPSKFCVVHINYDGNKVCETVDVPPEFHSASKESGVVEEDDGNSGCKKKENISLFYETTAGMLALIRPCGIVVSMSEMFTCESLTQVFIFLLKTFCDDVEDFQRVKYVGYDRACGLVPYLKNQKKNGSAGAKLLLDNVKFLVDIFHVSKHTEEVCMPLNNPKCKYHPLLPVFSEIHGTNTESCEQGFRRLNMYFKLTRKMTQFKRNVLFWFVNECFNSDLECELRRKGLM